MEVTHCIAGSAEQSHTEHPQHNTGRGRRALALSGDVSSMTVPRRGMNVPLMGQTGKKDIDEVQYQFLQASQWQHYCDLQLPVPASFSCCSYSNKPCANHMLQFPICCQLHPKFMPGICIPMPREQLLLFGLALLA